MIEIVIVNKLRLIRTEQSKENAQTFERLETNYLAGSNSDQMVEGQIFKAPYPENQILIHQIHIFIYNEY